MCGIAMRGADALPGSKATSRAKGSYRNLGYLLSGRRCRVCAKYGGPHRGSEEAEAMMHGHEKPDRAIVAEKPADKAAQPPPDAYTRASAAEPAEPRAGAHGKAGR